MSYGLSPLYSAYQLLSLASTSAASTCASPASVRACSPHGSPSSGDEELETLLGLGAADEAIRAGRVEVQVALQAQHLTRKVQGCGAAPRWDRSRPWQAKGWESGYREIGWCEADDVEHPALDHDDLERIRNT